nr:MAG TPA: hypothetical protein [Caudoviricetes sp.]
MQISPITHLPMKNKMLSIVNVLLLNTPLK